MSEWHNTPSIIITELIVDQPTQKELIVMSVRNVFSSDSSSKQRDLTFCLVL